MADFTKITGWKGHSVLYFGDHVYGDLADPCLKHGWRTGAVISDLEREVTIQNSPEFQRELAWYLKVQSLLERLQVTTTDYQSPLLRQWRWEHMVCILPPSFPFIPYHIH